MLGLGRGRILALLTFSLSLLHTPTGGSAWVLIGSSPCAPGLGSRISTQCTRRVRLAPSQASSASNHVELLTTLAPRWQHQPTAGRILPRMQFGLPGDPASIVSRVAEVGLKLKLVSHESVKVSVDGTGSDLMAGRICGVEVTGRGWASPKGLTCRTLHVEVGETGIDVEALKGARIDLLEPAKGKCSVIFNSEDFANFLAHPLLTKAIESTGANFNFKKRAQGEGKDWHRNAAYIEPGRSCVLFAGEHAGKSARLALFEAAGGVVVRPVGQTPAELCESMTGFFNGLVIDLDGAQLKLGGGDAGECPMLFDDDAFPGCVELQLSINVVKFPNPITTSF